MFVERRQKVLSNADIVKGVFPGGSITGSPKLRTMEIIEELGADAKRAYIQDRLAGSALMAIWN